MQAGEDLEEDEEDKDTEAPGPPTLRQDSELPPVEAAEGTPLLKTVSRSRSRSRRRRQSVGQRGDATVTQAVLMVCVPLYFIFKKLLSPL